jgi:hypothetical protein
MSEARLHLTCIPEGAEDWSGISQEFGIVAVLLGERLECCSFYGSYRDLDCAFGRHVPSRGVVHIQNIEVQNPTRPSSPLTRERYTRLTRCWASVVLMVADHTKETQRRVNSDGRHVAMQCNQAVMAPQNSRALILG